MQGIEFCTMGAFRTRVRRHPVIARHAPAYWRTGGQQQFSTSVAALRDAELSEKVRFDLLLRETDIARQAADHARMMLQPHRAELHEAADCAGG